MATLLRKMTMRSLIKFGPTPELTVSELITLRRQKELLRMYFGYSKIDFDDEVKSELCIEGEFEIKKPGKDWKIFDTKLYYLLDKINEKKCYFKNDDVERWSFVKEAAYKVKHDNVAHAIRDKKENAKIHNRTRNQHKF
jgi:hypothetical protein